MCPKWNILILKLMFVVVALCFYDNRDNRNNGLILNSMLSVDNNKNNFYQPEGWLPLDPTFTFFCAYSAHRRVKLAWAMPSAAKVRQEAMNGNFHYLSSE